MNAPQIVRLVLRASLSMVLLLPLAAAAPPALAGAAAASGYDPFFYGLPQQTAVSLGEDPTAPLATVTGLVLPYGSAAGGARSVWVETRDGAGTPLDFMSTDADSTGYYLLEDFAAGRATLGASYLDHGVSLRYEDIRLYEGVNYVDFMPGAVTWTSTKGGPLGGWSDLRIQSGGFSSSGPIAGTAYLNDASGTGVAWSLPGSLRWASCYYHDNEVAVWSSDVSTFPIAAGQLSAAAIAFRQESAARIRIVQPRWASGDPGTVIKVRFENWTAPTSLKLSGWDASFPVTTWNDLTYDVSSSPVAKTFSLKVPKTATVGKFFMAVGEGETARYNTPVRVSTRFQTCTFKADRSRVKRGSAIRLRGRIPVWEPNDTGYGKPKTVTIWARTRKATDAPATWNPSPAGWRRVATVRTDKSGRFVTPKLRPKRSTSYVCRYPGDAVHFRAYTSVRRVTVR